MNWGIFVSILILLEVILEEWFDTMITGSPDSFNPYFTGSNSGSSSIDFLWSAIIACFNPYFTGSNSGSEKSTVCHIF